MILYIDGTQVSTTTYNGGIGSISGTEGLYIGGDAGIGDGGNVGGPGGGLNGAGPSRY